ncbi:f-box domain-containing protein [Gigaspora margarita]|uniref:F-box domain-containing protein n=1 Tax=Gigaspora margarita TaxID=4874 RepID=A0A8H4EJD2_GIGMA|nr:f-box domain-containing protein [Gigaspora margarita]
MIPLPNECYHIIFNNFRSDYKNLFSYALVNRQWCRIVIPILWNDPNHHFKDKRLIKIFLLTLNAEEQALLIPFKITLPNQSKPLFEYTSYITSVNNCLDVGIRNFLGYKTGCALENIVKCSLIVMFLRTSKKLRHLSLNEVICNQLIFVSLCENATITSMRLHNISDDFKSKAIDALVKILYKNFTLTSLDLHVE